MEQGLRDGLLDLRPGYRTRVREDGAGDPLVLIHGTPLDLRAWGALVPLLAGRRLIRYDARGHGSARATPVPVSFRFLADDVAALLDRLAVDRAHLVGHSWGGQIAQRCALDHPDRLRRLSLVCTRSAPFPPFHTTAVSLRTTGRPDPETTVQRWLSPTALEQRHGIADQVRGWLHEASLPSWAAALELIAGFDVLDQLAQIPIPVDVICAEFDQVASPEHMAEMHARLPLGHWRLLRGARHLVPLEHPDLVAEAILADHDRSPPTGPTSGGTAPPEPSKRRSARR